MSSARRSRGFTLLELMLTLSMLSVLAFVVQNTLSATQEADLYITASRKAERRAHKIAFTIREAVAGARRLFQRDATGLGYLEALDVAGLTPAKNVRLPLFDEERPLGPDVPGAPMTGNVLLFVQESDPVVCTVDAASNVIRYMDVYYFVCCYPQQTTRSIITDDPLDALDLTIWYSRGYPSLSQIMAIKDMDQRASVVRSLYETYGFEFAWDPIEDVDVAFRDLAPSGSVAPGPTLDHVIERDPVITDRGCLCHLNLQLARTSETSRVRQAVFTAPEAPAWSPDGFEVKIVGASGHRKVWFRLVVEAQSGRGRAAAISATLIASVKDL